MRRASPSPIARATSRGESGSATARAISSMFFGHEASAVIASMRPSPLLVWTWETIPRIAEYETREVASESTQSCHFVCQCHSRDTLEKCNVYAQRVASNPPLTRKTLLNLIQSSAGTEIKQTVTPRSASPARGSFILLARWKASLRLDLTGSNEIILLCERSS
jgi:hypothetical protein